MEATSWTEWLTRGNNRVNEFATSVRGGNAVLEKVVGPLSEAERRRIEEDARGQRGDMVQIKGLRKVYQGRQGRPVHNQRERGTDC